jgi:hypothetical protein
LKNTNGARLGEGIAHALELALAHGDDVEGRRAHSQASAARRRRRCFSGPTISSGSPRPEAPFDFTSQKTIRRPRRAITSSSLPPAQTLVPRILYPRSR